MKKILGVFLVLFAAALSTHASLLYYTFAGSNAAPTSPSIPGLTGSSLTEGNFTFGGHAPLSALGGSSGYTTAAGLPASGTFNAQLPIRGGSLNVSTSSFFNITLTSSGASAFTISGVSMGSSPNGGGGPTTISLFSSSDGFVSDFNFISAVSAVTNAGWVAKDFGAMSINLAAGNSVSFRIYGSDRQGSFDGFINWRIDDLGFIITEVPEPATVSFMGLAGAFLLLRLRRRVYGSPPKLPQLR